MILSRRIRLRPSSTQRIALAKTAGCARWAWNWGLNRKVKAYKETGKSPSAIDLYGELRAFKQLPIEDGGVPWLSEVSKCAPQASRKREQEGGSRHGSSSFLATGGRRSTAGSSS